MNYILMYYTLMLSSIQNVSLLLSMLCNYTSKITRNLYFSQISHTLICMIYILCNSKNCYGITISRNFQQSCQIKFYVWYFACPNDGLKWVYNNTNFLSLFLILICMIYILFSKNSYRTTYFLFLNLYHKMHLYKKNVL